MSDYQPEVIVPRYKMIILYDILPTSHDSYFQFVMGEFVPALQEMGVYMTEVWHTGYGDYPLRMTSFVTEDSTVIRDLLESKRWQELEGQFMTYVRNYSRKIVEYRRGFQFTR